jgi:hypothetical protein
VSVWSRRIATLLALAVVVRGPAMAGEGRECGSFAFEDVAAEVGIDFRHQTGAQGDWHLRETMGAGVAWLDYDGDGWQDLYWVQSARTAGEGDRLYRNLDGRRFEVVDPAVVGVDGYGQGVLAADFDGDGDPDLLLTNDGEDALYLNSGDGTFERAASALESRGWSSSAAAADVDADGDLDLYITRYVDYDAGADVFCGDPETGERRYCDPSLFAGAPDAYFENDGGGRFVERTSEAGLGAAPGRGLGVVFTDLDADGDPDLYVANDLTINFLFGNDGAGVFEDLSLISGGAVNRDGRPEAGMGVAVGDHDGDLSADLAVTNFDVETNTLYLNLGGLAFADVSGPSGFGLPSFNRLAFGIVTADFDHDGDLDVYVANGHIFERPTRENVAYRQPDQILAGDGAGGFTAVPCDVLDDRPTVARGLAAGDFDNDGDLDLAVQENGGPARLLRNGGDDERWIGVRLQGEGRNTEAVGARVVLRTDRAAQVRWVTAGDSYQSTSDRRLQFGLGDSAPRSLEVTWPSGRVVRFLEPPAARYLVGLATAGR